MALRQTAAESGESGLFFFLNQEKIDMNVLCRDSHAENSSAQPLALHALLGATSFYSNPCLDPTMMSNNCLDFVQFGCDAKCCF